MAELRISLDPCNPGQFYACCGLIELFDMTGAQTLSKFEVDWRRPREATFVLTSEASLELSAITQAIREAEYKPLPRPEAEDKTPDKRFYSATTGCNLRKAACPGLVARVFSS
jgi:CRISPR-associated protein Csb3